ncbi:MAG: ATP-binding protein [Actinomycetota bacterium]
MRRSAAAGPGTRQRKRLGLRLKLFLVILGVTLTCILFFALLSNYLVRQQFDRTFEGFERDFVMEPLGPPPPEPPDIKVMKDERVDVVNVSYIITGMLGVLLAFVLSWYLADRISKPLSELTLATSHIAGGDYGRQVDVKGGREVEELGEAFNALSLGLERNEVLRKNMIADISHELRNPLAAQRGYLEALQDGVIELKPEALEVLVKNNALLARLVDDLQQLSLVDAGQLNLDLIAVNAEEALKAAASGFEHDLADRGITLTTDVEAGLPAVMADPGRLSQILGNLLANSLQYTPRGGSITMGARGEDREVAIFVSDTGPGIAAEELPFIFDRFHRTDRSRTRDTGGTGLGLSIAKGLVEAQGGRMWAGSEAGKGTTIFFTFPTA